MTDKERLREEWEKSFYGTIFYPRLFLTPFATVNRKYPADIFGRESWQYRDVYVFGFRVARLAR
ncbi:MAG: hypothetical protein AMS22_08440 [Thiotrichales bacterium SG8_50]|nr:MAG: hypothetical protein AMS22_08440 [Thiotrichales bacterium SG8_50]